MPSKKITNIKQENISVINVIKLKTGEQLLYYYKQGRDKFFVFENGITLNAENLKKGKILIFCTHFKDEAREVTFRTELLNKIYYSSRYHATFHNPFQGKRHSEESLKKQSQVKKGMYDGKKNPFYGKAHTETTREKISQELKGKMIGKNNPFYGKKHSEATKEVIKQLNIDYQASRTEEQVIEWKKKLKLGQEKFASENPELHYANKSKAGTLSILSHKKFKKNKLEQKVEDKLNELGIDLKYNTVLFNQKYNKTMQFDFGNKEKKILLMVNGDYWHGNPLFYNSDGTNGKKKLDERNLHIIENDKIKKEYASNNHYHLFILWENDFNNGKFEVLYEIKNILNEL
jgi:hypothetical protein